MRHFAKSTDTFYLRLLMRLVSNRGHGLRSPALDSRWGNPVTPRSELPGRTDCQVKTRFPPSIQEPRLIRMERINSHIS